MWGTRTKTGEGSLAEKVRNVFGFGRTNSEDSILPKDEMTRHHGSEDRCSTRKVIKMTCKTEEVEPGLFVRKCEKTEKLFRDCAGRPTELVESKTEYTEDDVTGDSSVVSSLPDEKGGISDLEPYIPPVFRGDFDNFQRGLFGGLDSFVRAAEEMAHDFFHGFRFPERDGESHNPFERFKGEDSRMDSFPYEQRRRGDKSRKEENGYGDFAKDFEEI